VGSDPDAKHGRIYQAIRNDIVAGQYPVGQRIPAEAALAAQHGASRPTVARALRELERGGYAPIPLDTAHPDTTLTN
jgi:DNA-binding GntR family transcriptional regulator